MTSQEVRGLRWMVIPRILSACRSIHVRRAAETKKLMEGLGVVGERDGVNLGRYKITTGRSDYQPRDPGTALDGMVQTNSTCLETDNHSPMNERGTAKIISVVYGASVQRSTAAVMACREESGGMVQNEEVSMRSLDIQESDMVTWVQVVDLGGAHSGSFMGDACWVTEERAVT